MTPLGRILAAGIDIRRFAPGECLVELTPREACKAWVLKLISERGEEILDELDSAEAAASQVLDRIAAGARQP